MVIKSLSVVKTDLILKVILGHGQTKSDVPTDIFIQGREKPLPTDIFSQGCRKHAASQPY